MGVDLVVAQPVSWLALVADYNRFATGRRQNFVGTFGGYTIGNFWFYALGALLVVSARLGDASPAGIAVSILGLSAGTVMAVLLLVSLLAGETHEAFADIYSAAISSQNLFPRLRHRSTVVVVGGIAAVHCRLCHPQQLRDLPVPARLGLPAPLRRPPRRLGDRRTAGECR